MKNDTIEKWNQVAEMYTETQEESVFANLVFVLKCAYDFWSKGIMSEALSAVITYLFQEVGLHRIMAKHDAENPASGEVMKKCGMTYEGSLKEHYFRKDGTYSDSIVYGIVNQ